MKQQYFYGDFVPFRNIITHTGYLADGIHRDTQASQQGNILNDRLKEIHLSNAVRQHDAGSVWESNQRKQQACYRIQHIKNVIDF